MGVHLIGASECSKAGQVTEENLSGLLVLCSSEAKLHQPVPAEVFHFLRGWFQQLCRSVMGDLAVFFQAHQDLSVGLPLGGLRRIVWEGHGDLSVLCGDALDEACIDLLMKKLLNLFNVVGLFILQAVDQFFVKGNQVALGHGSDKLLPCIERFQQAGEGKRRVIPNRDTQTKPFYNLWNSLTVFLFEKTWPLIICKKE